MEVKISMSLLDVEKPKKEKKKKNLQALKKP